MTTKVLFVDDEPLILEAYQRTLRNQFTIDTAHTGDEALVHLAQSGPYAVVVSDMRMPGMDGVQFLAKARGIAPDTVRMMLTGANNLRTAMAAVNQGQIFRFLSQPCSGSDLTAALNAGVEQHRLITAERDLLERTLNGAIKLLTEVLSLVNPVAFSRALRLTRHVQHMAHRLGLAHPWRFEAAAMLSQLGCVTLPSEILETEYAGKRLSGADQQRFALHPSVAHDLLVNIPRLELVARMIARQGDAIASEDEGAGGPDEVATGARLLRVALDFDRLVMQGLSVTEAISDLRHHPTEYSSRHGAGARRRAYRAAVHGRAHRSPADAAGRDDARRGHPDRRWTAARRERTGRDAAAPAAAGELSSRRRDWRRIPGPRADGHCLAGRGSPPRSSDVRVALPRHHGLGFAGLSADG